MRTPGRPWCEAASYKAMGHAKFSVDRLFIEHLIAERKSVPPEQARHHAPHPLTHFAHE